MEINTSIAYNYISISSFIRKLSLSSFIAVVNGSVEKNFLQDFNPAVSVFLIAERQTYPIQSTGKVS